MKRIKSLLPRRVINLFHLGRAFLWVNVYGYPAKKLKVVGVTGTDGKTTTSTIIYHLLKNAGKKTALITTVGAYLGNDKIDTGLHTTTPDPRILQKLIKRIVNEGYEYLVLETTSHAIDQNRLYGIKFRIAVLTNITHEHLDYHKTYNNYVKVKSRFLDQAATAVLNRSDGSFTEVNKYLGKNNGIISYDENTLKQSLKAQVLKTFPQKYNFLNATGAILAVKELGVKERSIMDSLSSFPGVDGRFEHINEKGLKVFVDFAHTPNALRSVLEYLLTLKKDKNRLIAVFGCTGERDVLKRPLMGDIATQLADYTVLTSDDLYNEDINAILEQIEKGIQPEIAVKKNSEDENLDSTSKHIYFKVPDRRKALELAILKIARKGDLIALCGKGHEKTLNIKGKEIPWNDLNEAKKVLVFRK